ncbi:MAG: hypothetical protein IKU15_02970 [Clostridia bacterium]|nr:hypothetical protein [Clostridia bacterium]
MGKKLIEPDATQTPIFSFAATYDADNDLMETTSLTSVLEDEPLEESELTDVAINKGFYQGEILSDFSMTTMLNYRVEVIYVELMPEFEFTH